MAITVADVESPAGELDRLVLFPDELEPAWDARIEGYIGDAESRSVDDDFVFHWVHYRAYHAKYVLMTSSPSTASLPEGGSYQFLVTQIQNMLDLANRHKADAEALLPVSPPAVEPTYPTTRAVANTFVF